MVVTVLCSIVASLFSPFDMLLPIVTVPLVVGGCAGVWTRRPGWAACSGAIAALLGCWTVLSPYDLGNFVQWIQSRMPQYAVQDTTRAIFEFIMTSVAAHPLTLAKNDGRGVLVVVLITALTAGVAAGVAWWRSMGAGSSRTAIAAWTVAGLLAACFVYTAWVGTASFRSSISREPADRTYAYDPMFNVKTYYLMRRGMGFYDAYLYAISQDARWVGQSGAFVDGKLTVGSPMMLRQPAAFYLWRVVGAGSVDWIVALSIAACAGLLVSSFAVLRKVASSRALFVVAMLYPGIMLHTVWLNVFFVDWWAALLVISSALLLIGRRYWAAGVAAFFAVLFRETAGAWMLVLIIGAVALWLRGNTEWRSKAIGYAGALLAAVGLFGAHYLAGRPHFVAGASSQPYTLATLLGPNAAKGLDWKLLSATSYMMQPYGLFAFPTWLMLPAASGGFWLSLPEASLERLALTAYPLMMLVYCFTVGATSSYWGQMVMPVSIVGTGLLLGRADLLIAQWVTARGAVRPSSVD